MSITYFVVLPFLQGKEGIVPGQAQELPNAPSALRLAEVMSPRSGPYPMIQRKLLAHFIHRVVLSV